MFEDVLVTLRQVIKFVARYENKKRSIGAAEQRLFEYQTRRLKYIEFRDSYAKMLAHADEEIAKAKKIIQQNTAFCENFSSAYESSKAQLPPDVLKLIEKAEKLKETENDSE